MYNFSELIQCIYSMIIIKLHQSAVPFQRSLLSYNGNNTFLRKQWGGGVLRMVNKAQTFTLQPDYYPNTTDALHTYIFL